jgi:GT2 family glycosyltransferase
LKGAGVGFLAVVSMPENGRLPAGNFSHAEIMLETGAPLRVVANALTSSPSATVLLQWTNDILSRARGEIVAARRQLRRIYSGAETISQLSIHLEIDEVCLVEGNGALITGWMIDPSNNVESVRLRAGRKRSENLRDRWMFIARPDVRESFQSRYDLPSNRVGFLAYAVLPEDPLADAYLEVTLHDGEIGFKALPSRHLVGVPAIRRILTMAQVAFDELDHVFGKILVEPLVLLNRQRLNRPLQITQRSFGTLPEKPRCSLVVPLYGRLDFITYQTALFSVGGVEQDELIYVLDEPERKQELFELAHSAYERFQVPFRLIFPSENRGFGPASNLGMQHAKGEFLCFLNSDIFPKEQAWLDYLVNDLQEDSTIGVASALLLFADGSVQHAGLSYEPVKQFNDWLFPLHPGKGLRPTSHENPLREVDGVTGACMVMRRALAEKMGGFDRDFIIGDFEDADLCQRIKETGLRCVVDERATLYHLERQSQGNQANLWRMNLTLVNAWTYGQRWDKRRQQALA